MTTTYPFRAIISKEAMIGRFTLGLMTRYAPLIVTGLNPGTVLSSGALPEPEFFDPESGKLVPESATV
jgi:hypothetical protein